MALSDINFQLGEGQSFICEIPEGILSAPEDILVEGGSGQYPVSELPEGEPITPPAGNIFIIND